MKIKKGLALLSIVLILSLIGASSAQPQAGVKAGDWIEYKVTYTGTPSPDHQERSWGNRHHLRRSAAVFPPGSKGLDSLPWCRQFSSLVVPIQEAGLLVGWSGLPVIRLQESADSS